MVVRALMNRGLIPTKHNMKNFPLFEFKFAVRRNCKLHRKMAETMQRKQEEQIKRMLQDQ